MQRLCRIELAEAARVVGDENEIAFACVARATFRSFQPSRLTCATLWRETLPGQRPGAGGGSPAFEQEG